MFNSKKSTFSRSFDVIIGKDSEVTGDVKSSGSVRVDGTITGTITSKGDVIVSNESSVRSDITCENIEIAGNCLGNVTVQGSIQLLSGSGLKGDIIAKSFNIIDGASFEGSCKINSTDNIKAPINSDNSSNQAKAKSSSQK